MKSLFCDTLILRYSDTEVRFQKKAELRIEQHEALNSFKAVALISS